jgi:hypothetical protein
VSTGRVDLSCRKRGGGGARRDSSEFTVGAAAWEADMDDHGLAPATREAYGRVSRGYLVFLESRGLRCLDDAEGASVVALASSDEAVGVVCDVITDRRTGPWQGAGQVGVEVSDLVAAGQPYWVGSRRSSVPRTCGVRCSIWVVGCGWTPRGWAVGRARWRPGGSRWRRDCTGSRLLGGGSSPVTQILMSTPTPEPGLSGW